MNKYIDEVAPSPYQRPTGYVVTADTMLRFAATRGLQANERIMATEFPPDGDEAARKIWNLQVTNMIAMHDLYVVLASLKKEAPEIADAVAYALVNAADAGDSYGEWFWQWCADFDLAADRIAMEAAA